MLPTLVRRLAEETKPAAIVRRVAQMTVANNPYKTRKVWPPDFKELNHQQQLRFEKKYKRRILLASRSPRWDKGIRFAQLATIGFAVLWLLFYSEFEWWGREYKPSEEMRRQAMYLWGILDPDKRYERSKDAPLPPQPKETPGKESPTKESPTKESPTKKP